jgi:methyl-accepting chemotaxis protein
MEPKILTPLTLMMLVSSLVIMYFMMRYLFANSVLFRIGISTAGVIIIASFVSGVQVKLGPFHNIWSFPLQVGLAVMAYTYIARTIKKPLLTLVSYIHHLSNGNLNIHIDSSLATQSDETGQIARALQQLQIGLRNKAEFARKIGDGKYDESFNAISNEDELGEALILMQRNLQHSQQQETIRKAEDKQRNWITEGQARFAEILRQNEKDVAGLSFQVISNLVKYMKINQGGIFIVETDLNGERFLELTACYAYDRRKFLQKRIEIGEGLAGTCFLEKETIYLRDVPQNYIRITSGLGDENPSSLLIIPLKINEEVFGVMELASFQAFEKYQIEFAEKIGEIIASSISALQINSRTTMLLQKSQQQAEEMSAQEEEMRQNMEELNATQEAMAEKERVNTRRIEELMKENEVLQIKLKEAYEKMNQQIPQNQA